MCRFLIPAGLHPTNFTVEAWVQFSSLDSTASGNSPAGSQYIVFKQNSQTYNFEGIAFVQITGLSSGDVFKLTVTSASAQSASVSSTTAISTNVWYHVAAIRNGSTLQLYVNGQLRGANQRQLCAELRHAAALFRQPRDNPIAFYINLREISMKLLCIAARWLRMKSRPFTPRAAPASVRPQARPAIATPATEPNAVTVGGSANFNVIRLGNRADELSMAFQRHSDVGRHATSTALSLANVQTSQGGNYSVVVTNADGSLTSAVAVLTVTTGGTAPTVTTQPSSQTVVAGGNATFSVAASGTAPLKYQWTFGGSKLSGATNASLTLSGAQSGNAGTYAVVVTNNYGSITSSGATLTVTSAAGMVTINGSQTFQVIDGFGANVNHRSWNNDELKPVINALINQAGMSLFHVIFDNNNWEGTNDNGNANSMNWTYYDTIYSSAEFQKMWGLMGYLNQQGITAGLVPDFEGPSPNWMGGLTLASGMENEYAETIASCLVYARKTMGLQFSTVGPVNEPDLTYSGINLSGSSQYVTVMSDSATQPEQQRDERREIFPGPDLGQTSTSWLQAIMNNPSLMSRFAHFWLHKVPE